MQTALATRDVSIDIPRAFEFLFVPARFKVAWGGRASAKSWSFARALLLIGCQRSVRVLCTRELQNSIKESVHKLLSDQIEKMGLQDSYEILKTTIRHRYNETEFIFAGIRHNINEIKSLEGIDICWVEEAQGTSGHSWRVLMPTIRKPGSEIWVSFNPELETDATYQLFVVDPPEGGIIRKVSYRDNPYFNETTEAQRLSDLARDRDMYEWIWEGNCRQALEGAVYAEELRNAYNDNRITVVPYERNVPVDTYWDLGERNSTAIWFIQDVGLQVRIIRYYENRMKTLDHYLQYLRNSGYLLGTLYLPHDGKRKYLGMAASVIQQVRSAGFKAQLVPKLGIEEGIDATRALISKSYFDVNNCEMGLEVLRHYRYEVSEDTIDGHKVFKKKPKDDWSNDGADALRYAGVMYRIPRRELPPPTLFDTARPVNRLKHSSSQSWMAG